MMRQSPDITPWSGNDALKDATDMHTAGRTIQSGHKPEIHYLCPDIHTSSAGIRRLFRHVQLLCQAGFRAHILHLRTGFKRSDMPQVPVRYLDRHDFNERDIIVIPEGFPAIMDALKHYPGRRFAIALNWDYIFKDMPQGIDWRAFNIERVLVVSPVIGKMITWSMGLPVHLLGSVIDHQQYYFDVEKKRPELVFIQRKATHVDILKRIISARNPLYIQKVQWIGLNGMSESEYAAQIRQASIFLNLSMAEGFPTSCMEAMASGALVAGYDAVGGQELLRGEGANQNSFIVPTGDYVSLAYALEPILNAIVEGNMDMFSSILTKAKSTSDTLTAKNETDSLLSFWHGICSKDSTHHSLQSAGGFA